MSSTDDRRHKLVEACVNQFKKDMMRIEDKQDDVKKQSRILEEIDEQIMIDAMQAQKYFDDYASSDNPRLYQIMIACQNQINFSLYETKQHLAQWQEDLVNEKRKLSREHEERERKYKEELHKTSES